MRVRAVFQGRVQGVGFRATARGIAAQYPVTGWVRNLPDGSVELEVQGEVGVVKMYLADLRRTMAENIARLEASEMADTTGEAGFHIRR